MCGPVIGTVAILAQGTQCGLLLAVLFVSTGGNAESYLFAWVARARLTAGFHGEQCGKLFVWLGGEGSFQNEQTFIKILRNFLNPEIRRPLFFVVRAPIQSKSMEWIWLIPARSTARGKVGERKSRRKVRRLKADDVGLGSYCGHSHSPNRQVGETMKGWDSSRLGLVNGFVFVHLVHLISQLLQLEIIKLLSGLQTY